MTTTHDLAQLEQQAIDAATRADEARAARDAAEAADAAERTRREQEWRRTYVDGFDAPQLHRAITDAREALIEALRIDPLGKALVNYMTAERIRYSERSFAGNAAALIGREPGSIGAQDPRMPDQRVLADPATLLVELATELAGDNLRAHELARYESFEAATTDHGRITAPPEQTQPTYCPSCQRLVDPDGAYRHHDGTFFHPDCPRPVLLQTQEEMERQLAADAKAARADLGWL